MVHIDNQFPSLSVRSSLVVLLMIRWTNSDMNVPTAISWCAVSQQPLDVTANGYKQGVTKKTLGTSQARWSPDNKSFAFWGEYVYDSLVCCKHSEWSLMLLYKLTVSSQNSESSSSSRFICHIHDYTESINQQWNVSQVRSMDSAIL